VNSTEFPSRPEETARLSFVYALREVSKTLNGPTTSQVPYSHLFRHQIITFFSGRESSAQSSAYC
jgi:hypothetical protein